MKYFKNKVGDVYAFSDTQLIDRNMTGFTELTPEELDLHLNPPVVTMYKTQYTSLEILARFTQEEQESIVTATATNIQLKLYYDKLLAATFIDVTDPHTIEGVDALILAGLLANNRRSAILLQEIL